ncbi:MAG: tetratricopeptide repeat protein [Proteobacteria bacterium]|nr:tetratricopeptide repeat protein [Pseudomonadota bacterium]
MASDANKKKVERFVERAETLLERKGTPAQKRENAQQAFSLLEEAILLDSENPDAWANRGCAKNILGDYEGSIADCDRAIELDPKNVDALGNRGHAKNRLGRQRGALADFNKAIKLDRNKNLLWSGRGNVKHALKNYLGAITDCNKAIKLDQNEASAWNTRGLARDSLNDHRGAISDYTRGIDIDPNTANLWSNRGSAKSELGEHKEAIADYDVAIELDPRSAVAFNNRGMAKFRLGQHEDAIIDLDKAIDLNPNNQNFQKNRQAIASVQSLRKSSTLRERREKTLEMLWKEVESIKDTISDYDSARKFWLTGLPTIILIAIFGIYFFVPRSDLPVVLPLVSIFVTTITVSIYWRIRILNREIEEMRTLKYDLFGRINAEQNIEIIPAGAERDKVDMEYLQNWMNKNPADRYIQLIRLRQKVKRRKQKEDDLSDIPPGVVRLIRILLAGEKPDGK